MSNNTGLLSYNELVKLVDNGVIRSPNPLYPLDIKGASIDVRLTDLILIESPAASVLELDRVNNKHLNPVELRESGILIRPQQVFLANTLEILDLPSDIVAEFVLKSSVGRTFTNQMQSNHADPGFQGSMTLELINSNQQHSIRYTPFCKIGQIRFHRVEPVPDELMYSKIGQYNNLGNEGPIASKGAK